MQTIKDLLSSILEIVKLTSRQLVVFFVCILIAIIIYLVFFIVDSSAGNCENDYKRLEKNYNIKSLDYNYISKANTDCNHKLDTMYTKYFEAKREAHDWKLKYDSVVSILKNKQR